MTREEAKSCIGTIELLQRLAYNIHGVMDVIDADNCKKIIKALEQEPRWIPVSERMPEKTGMYLISIGDLVTSKSFDGHNFRTESAVRFIPDAWMPLPEPFEP